MKLIYIRWYDAYWNEGACNMDNINKESPFILETSGFYIGDEKGYICMATERTPDGEYKFRHYIPKVNIIEKKIIEVGGKKKK